MGGTQVGPGSSQSGSNPIYGRKYKLLVSAPGASAGTTDVITVSDSSFEPEALRIVFDVYTPCVHSAYWYADIDIYNLDATTTEEVVTAASNIAQGSQVILYAGYENGNYDAIWSGPVFQALLTRENVVDLRLRLHCIISLSSAITGDIISAKYAGGANQTEILINMLKSIGLNYDHISDSISPAKLPRGKSFFGAPDKYFTQIAEGNNLTWFLSSRGFSIGSPSDGQTSSTTPSFTYSPNTGLLGSPQQTQGGVDFSVCLDPRLKAQFPLLQVGINGAIINQAQKNPGAVITPLDKNFTYVVGAVRHRGDSRGPIWQTEVTGYTILGDVLDLLANNANINSPN